MILEKYQCTGRILSWINTIYGIHNNTKLGDFAYYEKWVSYYRGKIKSEDVPDDDVLYERSKEVWSKNAPQDGCDIDIASSLLFLVNSIFLKLMMASFVSLSYAFFSRTKGTIVAIAIGAVSFILSTLVGSCILVAVWKHNLKIAAEAAVIIEILEKKNPQLKEGR